MVTFGAICLLAAQLVAMGSRASSLLLSSRGSLVAAGRQQEPSLALAAL